MGDMGRTVFVKGKKKLIDFYRLKKIVFKSVGFVCFVDVDVSVRWWHVQEEEEKQFAKE